jgi:hypothetical protein
MSFQQFQLGSFVLTLNSACYLVEVKRSEHQRNSGPNSPVPSWVFESKHTIWLTDENKPIAERARSGDRIKQEVLKSLKWSFVPGP